MICTIATQLLAPLAGGVAFAGPEALWDFAYDLNRCRGHVSGYHCLAMGALDAAVWDAVGRREGQPVARLIGSAADRAVRVYLSGIRRATRAERVEALKGAVAEGLTAAKIFIDADINEAARELEALRGAVGESCAIATDALWSFDSVADAAAARRRLAEWDVAWLECPMIPEDLAGHVALKAAPGVPVALGEHFSTHYQSAPWLEAKALDIFQPDISRTGISDGMRQEREAARHGISTTPHMGTGSPIVQAIALSFGAAKAGELPCEYQRDLAEVLPDVFDSGWVYAAGRVPVPDRPGLGIEVNAEALGRYSASVQSWQAR
jgi:galactonate dehydratase